MHARADLGRRVCRCRNVPFLPVRFISVCAQGRFTWPNFSELWHPVWVRWHDNRSMHGKDDLYNYAPAISRK